MIKIKKYKYRYRKIEILIQPAFLFGISYNVFYSEFAIYLGPFSILINK